MSAPQSHPQSESQPQPQSRYMDAARALNLLHLGESAGVVYWKPNGLKLYESLRQFIRRHHLERGYEEVRTPSLVQLEVFERSGHLAKYRDYMFAPNQAPDQEWSLQGYALRPMSCPNHISLFSSERRSYRQMPCRLFEFGEVFRNEAAGALQVLFRQRQFCQDDSHVFAAKDQVSQEVARYLAMAQAVYAELGFASVEVTVSLRPSQRFGDDELWDKAEQALRQACRDAGLDFDEEPGGGAFYGPKIELGVRDHLGRRWQLGVVQLDYVLPERFGLEYVAADDSRHAPVLLHHAVLGSLERMVGVLLEVHGVELPDFLHPLPGIVLPVSDKSAAYAAVLHQRLKAAQPLSVAKPVLDESSDKLGAKLRHYKSLGVPRIWVVGEREAAAFAQDGGYRFNLSERGKPQPQAGELVPN